MKTQSLIAALCVLMFAVSAEASAADVEIPAAAGLIGGHSAIVNDFRSRSMDDLNLYAFSPPSFLEEAAKSAADVNHLTFAKGQYMKLDDFSVDAKKVMAIEPNTLYMFGLGLLALFIVRRNLAHRH